MVFFNCACIQADSHSECRFPHSINQLPQGNKKVPSCHEAPEPKERANSKKHSYSQKFPKRVHTALPLGYQPKAPIYALSSWAQQ
eukprot:c14075_g1_i1 orf=1-252(-)